MDSVGAESCCHWRSWRGWRDPIQLFMVGFCVWSQRGAVPAPYECTPGSRNLESQNPGIGLEGSGCSKHCPTWVEQFQGWSSQSFSGQQFPPFIPLPSPKASSACLYTGSWNVMEESWRHQEVAGHSQCEQGGLYPLPRAGQSTGHFQSENVSEDRASWAFPGLFLLCHSLLPLQVVSKELVCKSCLTRTLNKLETMMTILQGETTQGTVTPTGIADNILNITGELCPWLGQGTRPRGSLRGASRLPPLPFGLWPEFLGNCICHLECGIPALSSPCFFPRAVLALAAALCTFKSDS